MSRQLISRILTIAFLVAVDIFIYVILGVALMNYDDKHDDSEANYGSWNSMTTFDKTALALMLSWNIINLIVVAFTVRAIYKRIKLSIRIKTD